jgi:ankyrin repeat protein
LEKGANVDHKDEVGQTPLQLDTNEGNLTIAEYLLDKGANMELSSNRGHTAILLAVFKGHTDIVGRLLEKGASMNVKDEGGNTLLVVAVSKGHMNIVQLLLDKGADPNVQDKDGNTALLLTVEKLITGFPQNSPVHIIKRFLDKGAKIIKNKKGESAFTIALKYYTRNQATARSIIEQLAEVCTVDGSASGGDRRALRRTRRGRKHTLRRTRRKGITRFSQKN